jgi:hypothetical protein
MRPLRPPECIQTDRENEKDMSDVGRFCCKSCKSLFALVTKNSPGCRRDFRVKVWGTLIADDKLTGDLGNVIEAT